MCNDTLSSLGLEPGSTLLIDGEWQGADSTFDVTDPATGAVLGSAANGTPDQARRALDAAVAAFPAWKATPSETRAELLRAAAQGIRDHLEPLADLMSRENGKPVGEARGELLGSARTLDWSAEEGRRAYGIVPTPAAHGPSLVLKAPVGPTYAIAPWNFPASMYVRKIALALAAGCTIVTKPAALTPLIAIALTKIINDAGLPDGVLGMVTTTDSAGVSDAILGDDRLRKVTFTGSTRVGLGLADRTQGRLVRQSLELGGHSPAIVLADADLDAAAASIVAAKFANNGQSCTAINRVYVPRELQSRLVEAVVAKTAELRLGHGVTPGVTTGPLINQAALEKVERQLEDAVSRGARIEHGGKRWQPDSPELTGAFFEPTVITNVAADALISSEETFGPLLPIYPYDELSEAVAAANGLEYGLASYLFGRDMQALWQTMDALDFGVIGVNDPFPVRPELPFGGQKNSGVEREGGSEGIGAYLEPKAVSIRW